MKVGFTSHRDNCVISIGNAAYRESNIRLWDCITGKEICSYSVKESPHNSKLLADGNKILFLDSTIRLDPFANIINPTYAIVKIWDISDPGIKELRSLEKYDLGEVNSFAYSLEKNYLLIEGPYTQILWDLNTGKSLHQFDYRSHEKGMSSFGFSPDGKFVLYADEYRNINIWDIANGKDFCTLPLAFDITRAEFLLDGKHILVSSSQASLQLWQLFDQDSCFKPMLVWTSGLYLSANDLNIENTKGLSNSNRKLLRQNRAINGEADREGVNVEKRYQKAADEENANAHLALGNKYYANGKREFNPEEPSKWFQLSLEPYRAAVDLGSLDAQLGLGKAYYAIGEREFVVKAKAKEWFRKAAECLHVVAESGNAEAQLLLGRMYCNGKGVHKDHAQGTNWYLKAADQGYRQAQAEIGSIGKPIEVGFVEDSASNWFIELAERGDAAAQFYLGLKCYHPNNINETLKWFLDAAKQGHARAQFELGVFYYNGEVVPKDRIEALKWIQKSAENGYALAQYHLGFNYYKGRDIDQDFTKAAEWYQKAAEQGNVKAQFNLGCMYEKGNGVTQDLAKALEWFQKAAEQGNEEAKTIVNEIREKLSRAGKEQS